MHGRLLFRLAARLRLNADQDVMLAEGLNLHASQAKLTELAAQIRNVSRPVERLHFDHCAAFEVDAVVEA